ncbi:hypothetical protein BT93_L1777 [Corymbia citriodora subsp. variegata]|uniref:TIR domain-containing protein n=1 Tax=Corymbia citriodora subsp. variegata TaxID=360336 RepID=A0A8T0CLZ1_CORYI|nr:hypothetical protein BT93_L1777 [Corymbia citriodora subsp. variegata]
MANRKYPDGPTGSTDNVEVNLSLGAEHEVLSTNGDNFASSLGAEYEVFLTFRGPNTRLNFVDCLYHAMDGAGIHVFKDDEEIRKGEAIGDELEHTIRNSAICIPIFSRNYASSAWCLHELAYMIDCKAMILPIFFDVEPKDVKLKTELYHDALQKHKEKFGCEVIQRWKETLEKVACMEGWDLKYSGIVAEVSIKLNKRNNKLPDHLVGIQDHVEDVMHLMDEGSLDVRYIVIHGMGEILNSNPQELYDSDAGIYQLSMRFRRKKVLIILDDLDEWDQLSKLAEKPDWFGLGSRIVITTRDTSFLLIEEETQENNVQMHFEEFKIYHMGELRQQHALKLFSRHAFRMDSPPHGYDDISREIALKALEVIGSSLYRQSKRLWKDTLKKLDSLPNQKVHHQLKISFDMLDNAQREIFLDIACYFIGEKKIYPHYMWKALELYPKSNIIVLTHKSLIKVDDDDRLMMHDLLRKLGRDIVQQENKVSGKHSRLWCPKVALEVVQTKRCLKHLGIIGARVQPSKLFGSPHFDMCAVPSAIYGMKCLLSLKLEGQCMQELHPSIGEMASLTCLSLMDCYRLRKLPHSIGKLRSLLELNLFNTRIRELPKSIGDLKRLEKMNLGYTRITELPNSIGGLKSLLDLDLQWTDITTLPASIGYLKRLRRLFMVYSKIRELHDSNGDLKTVEVMNLRFTQIRELPNSIGRLESLLYLNLQYTEITELPASIGHLKRLKRLRMYGSKIRVLPKAIGMLDNLEGLTYHDGRNIDITWPPLLWELDIFCDDPRSLPKLPLGLHYLGLNSVKSPIEQPPLSELRCLQNLHRLDVDSCKLLVRISGLPSLEKLERLSIFSCSQLMEIQDLEEMESLEKLSIGECNSIERLLDLSKLHKLRSLSIMECKALQSLPNLPNSLEYLFIANWSSIKRLSELSKLHKLQSLYVCHCESLQDLPDLSKACHLDVHACPNLGSLDVLESCWWCRKSNPRLFSRRPPKYG